MLSLLRLERKQTNSSNRIRIFLSLSYSFGIETDKLYDHTLLFLPRKPYPIPDQNGQSVYPFSDQNCAKTLPDGGGGTYLYSLYKRVPHPGGIASDLEGFRRECFYDKQCFLSSVITTISENNFFVSRITTAVSFTVHGILNFFKITSPGR